MSGYVVRVCTGTAGINDLNPLVVLQSSDLMMFWDETKKAIDIIMLKDKTPTSMGVGGALAFYYKATLIPLVLAIIVATAMGSLVTGLALARGFGWFSWFGVIGGILGPVLLLWVLEPIGALISAAFYHIVGRLFKEFKQDYNSTFAATLYAQLVCALLMWLIIVPVLGILVAIVAAVWEFVGLVNWISRFQRISLLKSFALILIAVFVILFIALLIIAAIAVLFALGSHVMCGTAYAPSLVSTFPCG